MNIVIPDIWLKDFLDTPATPKQIMEYLSLCGPSVERIHSSGSRLAYEIEVTTNRPDAMSVFGIAREAAAILPRFAIPAKLKNDPYILDSLQVLSKRIHSGEKKLAITTDPILNPRWTSLVLDRVSVTPSPDWMKKRLELSGIRSINIVVDVTNYLMRAYGQPAHAFDYDTIGKKHGIPTMILRASKKGEKLQTLDGTSHTLPGGDIVIEDGEGKLIDLCGIMGAHNSAITSATKTIVLFLQTYHPADIRKTSMALAHRTEAAALFEKGIDSQLVLPAITMGVQLLTQHAHAVLASKLYDIYPKPFIPKTVQVKKSKLVSYMGMILTDDEIASRLQSLGFKTQLTEETVQISVPSFRQDIAIDVDIIEEIARIHGYHLLPAALPDNPPPQWTPDQLISWEEEVKIRLRDWGYTEIYTYSMISDELMTWFQLDKTHTYKIANPLSSDWVYLRPSLVPSVLAITSDNLRTQENLQIFELAHVYGYKAQELPTETPMLVVCQSGEAFGRLKGLSEALFSLFGIPYPDYVASQPKNQWFGETYLSLGKYGCIGVLHPDLCAKLNIPLPITVLELNIANVVHDATSIRQFRPIPKYPPVIEDLAFIVPDKFHIGPVIDAIRQINPLVAQVKLLDVHGHTRTIRVTYLSPLKNLNAQDVSPVRESILQTIKDSFGIALKTTT